MKDNGCIRGGCTKYVGRRRKALDIYKKIRKGKRNTNSQYTGGTKKDQVRANKKVKRGKSIDE